MDEPFSALDPLIRRQLQDQFLELSLELKKTTLFITHDLDEAIRLGNRIAIMKDGVLVQIGTPEDIVTKPVDDYVTDFVAGISRLHLVYAHSVMFPVERYRSVHQNVNLDNLPKADVEFDRGRRSRKRGHSGPNTHDAGRRGQIGTGHCHPGNHLR